MPVRDLIESIHRAFPAERALARIADLMALDRFQASAGIEAAADRVAAAAEQAGLAQVTVHRFPADGRRRWWTFRAPRPWTPLAAELALLDVASAAGAAGGATRVTAYPEEPLSLATYSAPSPQVIAPLVELSPTLPDAALAGALAVVPAGASFPAAVARAAAAGALGLAASVVGSEHPARVGRIELAPDSPLFAFSLSPGRRDELLAAARSGRRARVGVEIDRAATMPLVEAVLPGEGEDEVVLVAHLCHPRPGANDNLSGVAALLGIAEALQALAKERALPAGRPTLRFLWGPEFLGTAAYLSDLAAGDGRPRPRCALNLDMVGEDPHRCGGPLIVERSPDHLPTAANALVEHCLELLPLAGRSYSGAVPVEPWTFRSTPFVGASDHGLFADRAIGCPALMLGHWPDAFNHTTEDTLDKVDPVELRRTATAAAATALLVAPADREAEERLQRIVARWAARRLLDVAREGMEAVPGDDAEVLAPFSREEVGWLLEHAAGVAVRSLPGAVESPGTRAAALWLGEQADLAARLLPFSPRPRTAAVGPPLERRWQGPFNLFGLLEDAAAADTLWLRETMGRTKGTYGLFSGLAAAIDGTSDREAALRQAAYATELPIRRDTAHGFFDVLARAGWIAEGP
jgi:uncharacterized protein DUF4910